MIGGLLRANSQEEFERWSQLGVDFVMLSVAWDYLLEMDKMSRAIELRDRFGMNLLIHPRPDGQKLLSPADTTAHDTILESLSHVGELIKRYGLINRLIVHLGVYKIPGSGYREFGADEAWDNSQLFYQRLNEVDGVVLAFENTYQPGFGWEEFGYDADHFGAFSLPAGSELCLDTGHLKLSELHVGQMQRLPFKLTCLHLHSNDGHSDQHLPLTRGNLDQWREVEVLLPEVDYVVIEVKRDLQLIPYVLEHLRQGQIAP